MRLVLRAQVIWLVLLAASIALLLAHLTTQYFKHVGGYPTQLGFERLFNLDGEHNLPAWFASLLLLLTASFLLVAARITKQCGEHNARYWLGLAVIFLYVAVDEATAIHETIIESLVRDAVPGLKTTGYLFYPWVIAGGLVVTLLAAFYTRFLFSLPRLVAWGFSIAAFLYVAGALGVDVLEASLDYGQGGRESLYYALLVALEEGLELAGLILFLAVLIVHLLSCYGPLHIILDGRRATAKEHPSQSSVPIAEAKKCAR